MNRIIPQVRIDKAIDDGLEYLAQQQEKDGDFLSLTAPLGSETKTGQIRHTTFHASLILSMVSGVKTRPAAGRIAEKAIAYLISQKSSAWSWNYWKKMTLEYSRIRVPDDLDDTFAALAGIDAWRPEILEGAGMAKAVQHLIATEIAVGGPYNTWIIKGFRDTV